MKTCKLCRKGTKGQSRETSWPWAVPASDAFKRVSAVKWNFLTLPKYQKRKFLTQFEFKYSTLPPHGGGV